MTHRYHRMHFNSLEALRLEAGKLNGRKLMIWRYVNLNRPMTDREIMQGLGFTDMNSVRPRVTELVETGMLEERGSKQCPVTKMNVRIVGLPRVGLPEQYEAFQGERAPA